MSKYSGFVERASSNSVRPTLTANLIHGFTTLIVVILCAVLYSVGWLFETLLLIVVLALVGWLGNLFFHRASSDEDKPSILHEEPMDKPEPYDERYHVKGFLKRVAPMLVLALIALWLMVFTILGDVTGMLNLDATMSIVVVMGALLIGGLVLLANAYAFYQQWWKWNNWRIVGDPVTGQIGFTQPDSQRWLFVKGSSTDYFNLDEYTLYTPDKSYAEFLIFKRSQMLGLLQGNVANASLTRNDFKKEGGPPYHEDIKDVDRLIAIQRYWRALARQEEVHSRSTVELLEELVIRHTAQVRQNGTIIRLLAKLSGEEVSPEELRGDPEPEQYDTQDFDE